MQNMQIELDGSGWMEMMIYLINYYGRFILANIYDMMNNNLFHCSKCSYVNALAMANGTSKQDIPYLLTYKIWKDNH